MSRPITIEHRRGATFSYVGTATLPAGTWTAASSLEKSDGTAVADLVVTLDVLALPGANGETHSLLLEKPAASTAAWPLGAIVGDILFTDSGGVVLPSGKFTVNVTRGVTNAA